MHFYLSLSLPLSLFSIPFFCTLALIFIYYLIISNAQKIISRVVHCTSTIRVHMFVSSIVAILQKKKYLRDVFVYKGYGVITIFSQRHVCTIWVYVIKRVCDNMICKRSIRCFKWAPVAKGCVQFSSCCFHCIAFSTCPLHAVSLPFSKYNSNFRDKRKRKQQAICNLKIDPMTYAYRECNVAIQNVDWLKLPVSIMSIFVYTLRFDV